MASFDEARERFAQAVSALENALEAAGKRAGQHQEAASELSLLRTRHAALEAAHAALQKSYDRLRQQQVSTAQRLDGAIASLHDVLSS
jgi:chromosome segregation ATPase